MYFIILKFVSCLLHKCNFPKSGHLRFNSWLMCLLRCIIKAGRSTLWTNSGPASVVPKFAGTLFSSWSSRVWRDTVFKISQNDFTSSISCQQLSPRTPQSCYLHPLLRVTCCRSVSYRATEASTVTYIIPWIISWAVWHRWCREFGRISFISPRRGIIVHGVYILRKIIWTTWPGSPECTFGCARPIRPARNIRRLISILMFIIQLVTWILAW